MSPGLELVARRDTAISAYQLDCIAALGVEAFVTGRKGGVSQGPFESLNLGTHVGDDPDRVAENRRRVAKLIDVTSDDLVTLSQVHGAQVVNGDLAGSDAVGDVITLSDTQRAAAILVADCVPIVVVAPLDHRLALVHAGWRGLSTGVIRAAVNALDSPPSSMRVVIGPSISGNGYQVGPEVARQFADLAGVLRADTGDRSRLDLREVAQQQLAIAGVRSEEIFLSRECTDGGTMFFSDRAERPCGRFAIVAKWSS